MIKGQIRIMTYNLEAHYKSWNGRPVKGRAEGIKNLILDLSPDVLCLQEADNHWIPVLAKIPHYRSVETLKNWQFTHMTTLLYNPKTMTLIKSGSIAYKHGWLKTNRRMCYGVFEVKESKNVICVISTHLTPLKKKHTETCLKTMTHQVEQLKTTVTDFSHRFHCPVIIGGDFNSHNRAVNKQKEPLKSYQIYCLLRDSFTDAKQSSKGSTLDHIFYYGNIIIDDYQRLNQFKELSDHDPLYIDCHLKNMEKTND